MDDTAIKHDITYSRTYFNVKIITYFITLGYLFIGGRVILTSFQRVRQFGLIAKPPGQLADVPPYRLIGHAQQASGGRDIIGKRSIGPSVNVIFRPGKRIRKLFTIRGYPFFYGKLSRSTD